MLALIFSCGQYCCEFDYNQQYENVTVITALPLSNGTDSNYNVRYDLALIDGERREALVYTPKLPYRLRLMLLP
ncbi:MULTISPECIES: hypothetical protein [unclassified Brenneria]|uniref:hypothetical protein n=1 Tax=unclassified Brenneria TaxID=2634434 RepID=UPI0018F10862|nr:MULTISPECIES: hypothetical protein [unclassified Brenneria]MBJ7222133.1 hypothetical protein [Brenneria sp. L3-3C-1]MEE3643376.1 hypothetical protein [Brenneria sp. L3_3C_1]MEE3651561.1 hypothetical protein [Brenneria sp. HEZEL_4_2_4]NPD01518.1 hypothetical protein [Brenneria sp. hezel4-2-4]